MNSATKNLENDHVHILRLIDVMERATKAESPDVNHLELMVDLIKSFADGFHHAKEETLLFPLLVEKGFSLEQGPVGVMLNEHVQGRNYVKGMAENIALYKTGNQNALPLIYQNMNGYISLLRNHINKENNILFKMADRVLTENDHETLLHQYGEIDTHNICGGDLNQCLSKIETLAKAYNV